MSEPNEINVKVTATTDDLQSKLDKGTVGVKNFGEEINRLAQNVASIKPDAFKELAEQFNAGKIDLDEFRDGLIALKSAQRAAAAEAATLAEKTVISSGALREFTVIGREIATGNLTRLPGSLSILATRLGGISPAAILATAGIAALGYAIYEAIEDSQKFEAELATIQNSLSAVGQGGNFNSSEITSYINALRQIPGVNRDAASSIVSEFSRARQVVESDLVGTLVPLVQQFAELTGKTVPEAAKEMAAAFDNPVKALQLLRESGVELSPVQQRQIEEMMAVNNVAGAQLVLLDGISSAMSHLVDNTTPLQRFWSDFGNSLSGVSRRAEELRQRLDDVAHSATPGVAVWAQLFSNVERFQSRNLTPQPAPTQNAGSQSQAPGNTGQQQEIARETDAVTKLQEAWNKSNAPLREQEEHLQRIQTLESQIAAAKALHDGADVSRGQALVDAENLRYDNYLKSQARPQDKVDDSAAKNAADVANAEIRTEQDAVNEKQRLGEISEQTAIQQLTELAAREHEINLRRIADMRSVAAGSGDDVGVGNADAQRQEEAQRYAQQQIELDQRMRESTLATQSVEIEGQRRVADAQAQTAIDAMNLNVATGQMTAQQEIQAEIESVQQRAAEEQRFFDQQLALYQKDSAQYQKVLNDKLIAEQKTDQQILQLRTQLANQSDKQDNQLAETFSRGLNQTVSGVLQGTQTMNEAFQRLGSNIVLSVIEGALDKMVTQFISNNATIQAAQQALNSFLDISNTANATDAISTAETTSHAAIMSYAGEGAAAAIASTSAIPIVGPELAPAAGAAIYGDIMAYNIASAAGGWVVPSDQMAMVHENEMILPAHLSQGISGMIANGQSGGGATNHFHVNVAAHGRLNAGDLDGLHDAVVGSLRKAARNGQFGGMR